MAVDYPPDPSHWLDTWSLFDRWLAFEHPHVEAVSEAAEATLTAESHAVVYQAFDADAGLNDQYDWTLLTLAAATPDPQRTFEAANSKKPIGVILRHELCDDLPVAPARRNRRAERIEAAVERASASSLKLARVTNDHRAPSAAKPSAEKHRADAIVAALTEVESAIEDGLRARERHFLVPPVVLTAAALADYLAYRGALEVRELVALSGASATRGAGEPPWRPRGVAICASCTVVFVPSRRRTASFCGHCSPKTAGRRPAPALGQRPIRSPGDRAAAREPILRSEGSDSVVGWRKATVGLCSECGKPFVAHNAKAKTCLDTSACRMRRSRRKFPSTE